MSNEAVLLGVTQGSSNVSSKVPGNRNLGRQDENPEIKSKKSKDEISVIVKEDATNIVGGGALLKQINSQGM